MFNTLFLIFLGKLGVDEFAVNYPPSGKYCRVIF